MLAFGRLLRVSLAPTALADVAAGIVMGAGSWPGGASPVVLMLASACVYHGAMALNDWADRAEDARVRPRRPIPSGAIASRTALSLAVLLLVSGPALAFAAAPRCGLLLGAVAACAALYDVAARGPWRGPLLLAVCRAGNLGVGLAYASTLVPWHPWLWLAPCTYGLYVFLVSRLARLEDVDPERYSEVRPSRWLVAAALALLAIGATAALVSPPAHGRSAGAALIGPWGAPALAGLGAVGLLRAARRRTWNAPEVQRAAGMALRRLLIASAAFALGVATPAGLAVASGILLGYPLSFALRRVFPPT